MSDMFIYVPVAFLTSYLKSSWITRGGFIVLAPKKYDTVGRVPMDNCIIIYLFVPLIDMTFRYKV